MHQMKKLCAAAAAVCLAVTIGCGGTSNPDTYPVSGTVMQNGNPVEGATVSFVTTGSGRGAVGVTDSSGKYELTTFEKGDGAVPGQYKVTVVKYDRPQEVEVDTAPADTSGDDGGLVEMPDDYAGPGDDSDAEAKNLLPKKYSSVQGSPLEYTVTEGENTYPIELDAK